MEFPSKLFTMASGEMFRKNDLETVDRALSVPGLADHLSDRRVDPTFAK
jgi:hypothetical protein